VERGLVFILNYFSLTAADRTKLFVYNSFSSSSSVFLKFVIGS